MQALLPSPATRNHAPLFSLTADPRHSAVRTCLLLLAAAADGVPEAAFLLGLCHETGTLFSPDPGRARAWYGEAAAQSPRAPRGVRCRRLEALWRDVLGPVRDELTIRIQAKDPIAQAFTSGGAPGNRPWSRWYGRSDVDAPTRAEFALARQVLGADRDLENGIAWLRRSAEGGLADAQLQLALLLDRACPHYRDPEEALRWFRVVRARLLAEALGGSPEASLRLGILASETMGDGPHLAEARRWLAVAAGFGHPEARHRLRTMEGLPA